MRNLFSIPCHILAIFSVYNINGKGGISVLRKCVIILCILALCCAAWAAGNYEETYEYANGLFAVRNDDIWHLTDAQGNILLSGLLSKPVFQGDYAVVSRFGGIIPEDESGSGEIIPIYGLIDTRGSLLLPFEYDELHLSGNTLRGKMNEMWGLLDVDGTVLLPFEYDYISDFILDRSCVYLHDEEGHSVYGMIDSTGRFVLPPEYAAIKIYDDGQVIVRKSTDDPWEPSIYMNLDGECLLETEYFSAKAFQGDYAVVGRIYPRGKDHLVQKGIINRSGKEILPCIYDFVCLGPDGRGTATMIHAAFPFFIENDTVHFYYTHEDGTEEILPDWASNWAALIPLDGEPKTYLACQPDWLGEDQWIYVDASGNITGDRSFAEVTAFSEGFSVVQSNGRFGYIDRMGKIIVEPTLMNASAFSDGLASVTDDGYRHGYIDTQGNYPFEPVWRYTDDFKNGYALVRTGGFDFVEWYHNPNEYGGSDEDVYWGIIDTDGNYIFPLTNYDSLEYYPENLTAVADQGNMRLIFKLTQSGPVQISSGNFAINY